MNTPFWLNPTVILKNIKLTRNLKPSEELIVKNEIRKFRPILRDIKKRRNVTFQEMQEMEEEQLKWNIRFHNRRNLTLMEEIEFEKWTIKKCMRYPKVRSMILRSKPIMLKGNYWEYNKKLQSFGIDVHQLLHENQDLIRNLQQLKRDVKVQKDDAQFYQSLWGSLRKASFE